MIAIKIFTNPRLTSYVVVALRNYIKDMFRSECHLRVYLTYYYCKAKRMLINTSLNSVNSSSIVIFTVIFNNKYFLQSNPAFNTKLFSPTSYQKRTFWEYVNMMFNKPDPDRIKLVGPDRACAEWVLRNGGRVVWAGGKKLADYNSLPPDNQPVPKLIEIDGTDSSISHYGFSHLSNNSF